MSRKTQTSHKEAKEDGLPLERVVFFSDAVFAIAITLLALEIKLPELEPQHVSAEIRAALLNMIPQILVFALSFAVVGMYWVNHHRLFRDIKGFDYRLVWVNLGFLFCVAFIPIPTAALGRYPDERDVIIFYAASLAVLGITNFVLWWYADHEHYIDSKLQPELIRYISVRILTPPAIFLLSIPLAFWDTNVARLSWILIYILFATWRFIFPHEHALRTLHEQS